MTRASLLGYFWEGVIDQSVFALALLAVAFSGRLSWGSVGLERANLALSSALGGLYTLIVVLLTQVAPWLLGYGAPVFQITSPNRYLSVFLVVALFQLFWRLFESVWMCYLIYAGNRWLPGGHGLSWRVLFLAALLFGLLRVQEQLVFHGVPLPQALLSGLALLIPGTIPKLTGNAWRLVLWFTMTSF